MIDKLNLVSKEKIEEIKKLNIKSEKTDLDFKEIFKISDSKSRAEFIKDVAAFANSKGGYIIYGVNNNYDWVGLDEKSDENIDEANISNIIDEFIDGEIEIISNIIEIEGLYFFILYVEPSNVILPFKKDGQYQKKSWGKTTKQINTTIFKNGDVYCRRGSRSIKADNLFYRKKQNQFKIIENVLEQNTLYNEFIGRKEHIKEIYTKLNNENNRIIQIDGIGGIGKTSFVHYFCKQLITNEDFTNNFEFIIWTSSKRNKYTPDGIKSLTEYVSNYSDLIEDLYKFIEENSLGSENDTSDNEKNVIDFLNNNTVLLIVDNLETLNDPDLISFLEKFPSSSKAILTTRETLGDFFMARINLNGFKEEKEFPDFLNSQYKNFTGKDTLFTDSYNAYLAELYKYTKGMPLAGQLITHQLAMSTPMESVIQNLKSGEAYHDILTFCFQGSIDKLSEAEKQVLYILSLSEKEELLTADDIRYISEMNSDEIGFKALPQLAKISLCYSQMTDSGEVGYTVPHLAKIYTKNFLKLNNEKNILEKYELFTQERKTFLDGDLNHKLLFRSNASNHQEKVAANQARQALYISNLNYDIAKETIDELIKHNSKFPFLYLIKGKILDNSFYSDAYELAKKEFLIAIDLDHEFLEAFIELGFLDLKNRVGKSRTSREIIKTSIGYFEKALKIDHLNHRAHHGLAQALSAQSKDINYFHNKNEKHIKANLANDHFEKAYHKSDSLTPTQKHSNAINAFNHTLNYYTNLRDYKEAYRICNFGLTFEPNDMKLRKLKDELEFKVNPKQYTQDKLKEKGWIKSKTSNKVTD
ncbi:RNA-binding domain-containing protein [Flavobacterium hauense]